MNALSGTRKKKLFLIHPRFEVRSFNRNAGTLIPLGLAYIAAYTPDHWEVEIHDEQEQDPILPDADLVGISTTTGSIMRAYEIARIYRERKIPVIMGGIHASTLPDEAIAHCDSVVIGDAEPVWETVIADFERGALQRKYVSPIPPLDNLRQPRRDLLKGKYLFGSISTSRGCPFRCTFCAIHNFYQHTYRMRPIEEVIAELKTMRQRLIFFTDGNLFGYTAPARERFVELCKRLVEERRRGSFHYLGWMAYATVNILEDEEALTLAAQAGCISLLIGFESINENTLKEMKKGVNIKRLSQYRELIANARRHGILVTAELVLGFDNDTQETLELTRKFVREADIDVLRLQILQPLPGTEVFAKLAKEGRLYLSTFPQDWTKLWDQFFLGINFEMKSLDPYELIRMVTETGKEFYSVPAILKRGLRLMAIQRSPFAFLYYTSIAFKSRGMYKNYTLCRETLNASIAEGRKRRTLAPSAETRDPPRPQASA